MVAEIGWVVAAEGVIETQLAVESGEPLRNGQHAKEILLFGCFGS